MNELRFHFLPSEVIMNGIDGFGGGKGSEHQAKEDDTGQQKDDQFSWALDVEIQFQATSRN